ncbi:IS5 family transposase [Streptomyces hypolithicus]
MSKSNEQEETLVLQSVALAAMTSNSGVSRCDCLAHRFGNAGDHPDRAARYPSDTTDAEWAILRAAMPVPAWLESRRGRPESYCHRQMLDAVFYLLDGGIKWRAMPIDFPPWDRVYAFFHRWRDRGLTIELHDRLRARVREDAGRDPEPTAAIIDSQTIRSTPTVPAATSGYDGNKKTVGRKRHLLTDTIGMLLAVTVTGADVGDRDAGQRLIQQAGARHHRIRLIWADGGYTGFLVSWCAAVLGLVLEIVKRSDDAEGFQILPRRWVVERTNAWLCRTRRLDRDYERRTYSSETMIYWSMVMLMRRRLARRPG